MPKLEGASDKISKEEVEKRLEARAEELSQNTQLTEEEVKSKMNDEKVMIALEKMKLANKKKEVIKVFNNDGSNKTVVIEDGMTAAVVCYLLVTKNHFEESPNWALIERLGDVGLGQSLLFVITIVIIKLRRYYNNRNGYIHVHVHVYRYIRTCLVWA